MRDFLAGEVIGFHKPYGWTSFDLVNKFRYALGRHLHLKNVKVGHAGTLDPLATGVLILCTGGATRRIEEFQEQDKEYVATLCLGATTPSFDLETAVDRTYAVDHITLEGVRGILPRFLGTISQVPPAFSACKVGGERAYARARKGEEVRLAPKTLVIREIEVVDFGLPFLKLRIVCSKGTYIRALARDMGEALASGGHLTELVRTRIGETRLSDCLTVEQIPDLLTERLRL
jgi:tRNA pseudouridine55 synthase